MRWKNEAKRWDGQPDNNQCWDTLKEEAARRLAAFSRCVAFMRTNSHVCKSTQPVRGRDGRICQKQALTHTHPIERIITHASKKCPLSYTHTHKHVSEPPLRVWGGGVRTQNIQPVMLRGLHSEFTVINNKENQVLPHSPRFCLSFPLAGHREHCVWVAQILCSQFDFTPSDTFYTHDSLSLSLRECIQNKVETREHTHTSMHARKQLPFFGSHTHAETQPLSLSPPLSGNQRECHNRSHAPSPPPRRLTINTGMDMNMLSCSDFPPSRFAPSLIPNIPSLSLSVAIKCFSYDLALCSRTTSPPFSAHTRSGLMYTRESI